MSWSKDIFESLRHECRAKMARTPKNISQIPIARNVPSTDNLQIGGAKTVTAAVLFFDLRGFTQRISSDNLEVRLDGLTVLNAIIPVVSRIVYEAGGYIEKNTGDGIMAIIGADKSDSNAARSALEIALAIFAALDQIINPALIAEGITPTAIRMGIDYGPLLLARIGLPSGSATMDRNFLTAIGVAANIACKIQHHAGTNELWVGDSIRLHAPSDWLQFFRMVTIPEWPWIWVASGQPYYVWNYVGRYTARY